MSSPSVLGVGLGIGVQGLLTVSKHGSDRAGASDLVLQFSRGERMLISVSRYEPVNFGHETDQSTRLRFKAHNLVLRRARIQGS